MLGADLYETEAELASILAEGKVPIGVGQNTKIRWVPSSHGKCLQNADDTQSSETCLFFPGIASSTWMLG